MKDILPRSGYDLVAKILESHPNDAIATMLKYSNGAECDWLEFKAGMTLLPDDVARGYKPDDLYWDYLLSIVAMANTRGGAFVIGVNDHDHASVSLESCDPRHVIKKRGKEAYLREEVVDKFDRPDRKWKTKDGTVWGLTTSIISFIDARIVQYGGADAIVLLVSPSKSGGELYVSRKVKDDEYDDLPIRKKGEVGRVKRLTRRADCDTYVREREVQSSQLGAWWAELDAEQQALKADETLDNAIRAYHAKLEEETRKKLRAFIPLDAEGEEPDEEKPVVKVPSGALYRESDLADSVQRQRIAAELERRGRLRMTIASIAEDRDTLVLRHPLFQEGICGMARVMKYRDMFKVGQVWSVKVRVGRNAKDGSFCFFARKLRPTGGMPILPPDKKPDPANETKKVASASAAGAVAANRHIPLQQSPVTVPKVNEPAERGACPPQILVSPHCSIYIDETWPGTQDHAYKDIGVIGGVVVPWAGVDEGRLPVIKTHLGNGAASRDAIQAMLSRSDVFPFVLPIKWDQPVGTGGRLYFELVQHALMLLLGWLLPPRDRLTTVDVYLEHITGFVDGHDETDFISSLTQAMRLLSGGRRFANWQVRRVEWVDKEFGYVPYGDLVCKTCVPRKEQMLLAHEVNVREWAGYLPFSKNVFPLLRDMDTASPAGLADLLVSFAKTTKDTQLFRHVREHAVRCAKANVTFRDAVFSRFEAVYAQPERDIALLNRVVPYFLKEFPVDAFEARPRMQMLRILIGFQHANHNGDPDLAAALVGQYHALRPRILELDRDLCAYVDLNLAVHEHDMFEFGNALSLVDGWIDDPLFPALSVMNRGRMFSSRGQSLALLGRHAESDGAFARALALFSVEPELLAKDIEQTTTYRAMNALDHDAPSAVPHLEKLLGKSLLAAAPDFMTILERPFVAHLFLKTLWLLRAERPDVLEAFLKALPTEPAVRRQHPYELILFYLAILTKSAHPAYAAIRAHESEKLFDAGESGGTLGLVRSYLRVKLKRHGFNSVADDVFLGELDRVERDLPKTWAVVARLRAGWTDATIPVDGILPFNYC